MGENLNDPTFHEWVQIPPIIVPCVTHVGGWQCGYAIVHNIAMYLALWVEGQTPSANLVVKHDISLNMVHYFIT